MAVRKLKLVPLESVQSSRDASRESRPSSSRSFQEKVALATLLGICWSLLLHFLILALRAKSAFELISETTGVEYTSLLGVWKIIEGRTLYEPVFTPPYSPMAYNFLFYWSYGLTLKLLNLSGDQIIWGGRALSLGAAFLGMAVTFGTLKHCLLPGRYRAPLALAASAAFWLGSHPMSWFSLSVRPDALALAVSALGFFVYVRGKKGPATLIATAVLLFVAWSIKQSYVGVLGGLCLHTILRDGRSPRGLIMPISFAAMVAGALILGGENYRAAIIGLGGLTWFIPYIGVDCLVKALVPQIPLVTTIVIAYVAARPRLEFRDLIRRLASANGPWAAAACVATWSLVFHFYASARFGPSRNHFFETNLAIFILAMLALDKLVSRARPHFSGEPHYRQYSVISALLLGWYPLLTLLGTPHFGNTGLTKPSSDTIVLRDAAKAFPKPVLSLALPYSLPWNTTEPGQPAYMIDSLFYGLAKGKKKLPRGGIEQSLEETRPATIIVPSGERETIRIAVDKAYRPAEGRMRELADRLRLVILFRADRTPPSQ